MCVSADEFYSFYSSNLRSSLFSGFLTLSGFLLSAKTFLIINLKKEVYDHKGYKDRVQSLRSINPNLSMFGPLKRLSSLMFWAVLLSLTTAVSQLTIGLVPKWWSAAICLSLAAVTVLNLGIILFVIKSNLKEWFCFLEEQATGEPKSNSASTTDNVQPETPSTVAEAPPAESNEVPPSESPTPPKRKGKNKKP